MQTKDLISDGIATLAARIANMIFAAMLGIITARALGPEGRGLYVIPSLYAGFVIAAFSGLSTAMSYYLLNGRERRATIAAGLRSAALLSIVGVAVTGIIAVASHAAWAALPAMASVPFSATINLLSGFYFGVKRVKAANTLTLATTLVSLSMMFVGLYLIAKTPSIAIAMWVASTALAGLAALILLARASAVSHGEGRVGTLEFLRYALKVGSVNIVSLLNYRIDVYIVALFASPAALGIYGVAISGAEMLGVVTQVASIITVPHIGSLERSAAAALTARCARNNLALALVLCLIVGAIAPFVLGVLYGPKFLPAVLPLRVLLVGVAALSMGSVISSFYTLKLGRPQVPLVFMIISAIICAVVSLIFVPRIGIVGAAAGTALSYAISQVMSILYFTHTTGLHFHEVVLIRGADIRAYRRAFLTFGKGMRYKRVDASATEPLTFF